MNFYDGIIPTYKFSLRIERSDRPVLNTEIIVKGTPDEITKAKENIKRLLTDYPQTDEAPESVPTPAPEADENGQPATPRMVVQDEIGPPLTPEQWEFISRKAEKKDAEQQEHPTDKPEHQQDKPTEAAPPQGSGHTDTKKPDGVRGLIRLRCPECSNTFGTFLRDHQTELMCKCGHSIDLTAPLARYRFTCPYCGKETWGLTNLEDPEIIVPCKCSEDIYLRWNSQAKEYQN